MANETQTPPTDENNENRDPNVPQGGWPLGMFPSPIVHAGFDPYTDPQDKLDYYNAGGSQDALLRLETERALRRQEGQPGSYPDHAEMVEHALNMVEEEKKRQRIKDAFRRP